MLGLLQKLLYVLTLGPFEKSVKGSRASGLNFDLKPTTLGLLDAEQHENYGAEQNPGVFQGLKVDLDGSGRKPESEFWGLDRVRMKRETNLVVASNSTQDKEADNRNELTEWEKRQEERRKEQEELDKYTRQVRIIRFGIWMYILYAVTVCWFFGGVSGTEDLVLYMKRVGELMVIAAAVDATKYFFDLRSDPNMRRAVDILILVLGVGATTQIVLSIPQFFYELTKLF